MNGTAGSHMVDVGALAPVNLRTMTPISQARFLRKDRAGCTAGVRTAKRCCKVAVQHGERLIGYKVGCTSSAIQEQLKISHRVRGFFLIRSSMSPE